MTAPRTPYAPELPRLAAEAPATVPGPDGSLSEIRLVDADLGGRRVAGLRLTDVVIEGGNLANLVAPELALRRVAVSGARLTGVQWTAGTIADAVLRDCRIDLATFAGTTFERTVFDGCRLAQADFRDALLRSVRFDHCDLSGADLTGVRLDRCELRRARWTGSWGWSGCAAPRCPGRISSATRAVRGCARDPGDRPGHEPDLHMPLTEYSSTGILSRACRPPPPGPPSPTRTAAPRWSSCSSAHAPSASWSSGWS